MRMTYCRECKGEISSDARTCPHCAAKTPGFAAGNAAPTIITLVIAVLAGWWLLSSRDEQEPPPEPERELTIAERYPGQWHEEFNADIANTLASNAILGCGQFKFKASSQDNNEYVVYCTRDGTNWSAYLVWTAIDEVTGPHKTDPLLSPKGGDVTAAAAEADALAHKAEAAALAAAEAAKPGRGPNVEITPTASVWQKIPNVEMLEDYTRNNAFDRGDVWWVWKVAIIPKGTSQKELVNIAKQLFRAYPKKRIRIFDDKEKVKQFIQRDIYFNDKSGTTKEVAFPEEWVVKHHIANINDRSEVVANRWQLVTRHGNHIEFLE